MNFSNPLIVTSLDSRDFNLLNNLKSANNAVIVMRGFIHESARSKYVDDLSKCRDYQSTHNYPNTSLTTLGPYIAKHTSQPKEYFSMTLESDEYLPPSILLLRRRIYRLLKLCMNFDSFNIAVDDSYGKYSGSIVRFHGDGVSNPLHNDNIARDAKTSNLLVGKIAHQLSCVICLQECTSGGALRIYNKKWSLDDEKFKIKGNLGYQSHVIDQYETCTFVPQNGDIYVFDPGFYHEIDRVQGAERITMGFFFGSIEKNFKKIVAWS